MEVLPMEIGPQTINYLCNFIPIYIIDIQAGIYKSHYKVSLNLNLLQESFIAERTGAV